MRIYEVGGAVRDRLLGLPVRDRDWVVVGSTPEQMVELGFKPVGRDFPVFLHPETHEEYALARTERKVAPGYHGFQFHADPAVTLEQDLERRDLTINAMATDAHGRIIDPYGGRADLAAGVLRHISPAFAEDPVRILRLARFAARFDFRIADATLELMRSMVARGEVAALVPERVWLELSKGLQEVAPMRFFATLQTCGALQVCLPECQRLASAQCPAASALARAAALGLALPARFAVLALCIEDAVGLAERLRLPAALLDLARLCSVQRERLLQPAWAPDAAESLLQLIERADALRRPQRLEEAMTGVACLLEGESGKRSLATVLAGMRAARAVDAGAIAAAAGGTDIAIRVRAARLKVLADVLAARKPDADRSD